MLSPELWGAPPVARLEKEVFLPSTVKDEFLRHSGWLEYDERGRYLAGAYQTNNAARLTVWETSEYKIIRDSDIYQANAGNEFGLRFAFHPSGSHVLEFSPIDLRGWPLGAASNTLLAKTVDRGPHDITRRKSMFWVGSQTIKHITISSDNTLYIDSLDPDSMKHDPKNKKQASVFIKEKKFDLEAPPSVIALHTGSSQIAWVGHSVGNEDRIAVRLLDIQSAKTTVLPSEAVVEPVASLSFSPDGKLIIAGGHDGFVRLWRVEDRKEIFRGSITGHAVTSISFSSDGRLIALGSSTSKDANLYLFDISLNKIVWVERLNKCGVISVAFGPKQDNLAVLSSDKLVRIFDIKDYLRPASKK